MLTQRDDEAQLGEVHPELAAIVKAMVGALPFDCFIVRGRATTAQQKALYAIGRTVEKWRKPVTYLDGVSKKSRHQMGMAVDVAPTRVLDSGMWVDTTETNKMFEEMGFMAENIAVQMGITDFVWGGRWKMRDMPHFELTRLPTATPSTLGG